MANFTLVGVPGMGKLNSDIANLVKNDVLHRQGKKARREKEQGWILLISPCILFRKFRI